MSGEQAFVLDTDENMMPHAYQRGARQVRWWEIDATSVMRTIDPDRSLAGSKSYTVASP